MFQPVLSSNNIVRPLPFPFKGALTISSDAEFFSFDFFEELMKFLNTKSSTRFGLGLGLEVSSSTFFYSNKDYNFSYFKSIEAQSPLTSEADRIREYIKAGWIDANHAHGDFDGAPVFKREHAERILAELQKSGLALGLFTNHGGVENIQNIGSDSAYHKGDDPQSVAYHRDLLEKMGVKFVWTDSLSYLRNEAVVPPVAPKERGFRFWSRMREEVSLPAPERVKILVPSPMQDGTTMQGFMRFRSTGRNAPNLSSFGYQIDQIDFNDLYENNGAMVIYQHLGVLARENGICHQATFDNVLARPEAFLAGFHKLSAQAQKGKLWVSGTERLLTYLKMIGSVQVTATDEAFEITCPENITNPDRYFQGLTVYVAEPRNIILKYKNKNLLFDLNGPDETGKYSVTVRLQKLENIWN